MEDYYRIVTRPMDLQTIRDNLRQKRYQSREEFLADVNQIVDNSTLYNGNIFEIHMYLIVNNLVIVCNTIYFKTGNKSSLTVAAQRMWARCVQLLTEKEDQLMRLEKAINPLLDDNDQVIIQRVLNTFSKLFSLMFYLFIGGTIIHIRESIKHEIERNVRSMAFLETG